jgi:putative serine protease PepD
MAGEDKQLTITRDGMEFKAIVLWMDETRDVAMLKITDPHAFEKAPKARLSCDSPDAVIGTKVHSIGYPLDLGLTHTWGRVGSKPWKHRTEDDGSGGETYQTLDIAIAPGNSGGPIFDQTGEVIGLSDAVPVVPMGPFAVSLAPYGLIIPRTSICNSMIEHIPQEVASN